MRKKIILLGVIIVLLSAFTGSVTGSILDPVLRKDLAIAEFNDAVFYDNIRILGIGMGIKGGKYYTIELINEQPREAHNVRWYVNLSRDFGLIPKCKNFSGLIETVPANSTITILEVQLFGIGCYTSNFTCAFYDSMGTARLGWTHKLYVIGFYSLPILIDIDWSC